MKSLDPLRAKKTFIRNVVSHGFVCLFILLLLNVPVNSYCHVGTVTSDFVGLLPDFEMIDTPRPSMKLRSSKQIMLIGRGGPTYRFNILGKLRPSKRLNSTQVLSQFAVLRGDTLQLVSWTWGLVSHGPYVV